MPLITYLKKEGQHQILKKVSTEIYFNSAHFFLLERLSSNWWKDLLEN